MASFSTTEAAGSMINTTIVVAAGGASGVALAASGHHPAGPDSRLHDGKALLGQAQLIGLRRRCAMRVVVLAVGGMCLLPASAAARTNPWFPLTPGSRWVYEGHDGRH